MPSTSKVRPQSLADQLLANAGEGEITPGEQAAAAEASFRSVPRALLIPIERLTPSQDNPRTSFENLDVLADSIAERGVLQPLVVRRDPQRPGYYITIAGARRLLAANIVLSNPDQVVRAHVMALPCVVSDDADRDAFADALAENLARQDLSRAEVMAALLRLEHDYGWSARYIARRIGRSASDVAELLGIAKDDAVSVLVAENIITPTVAGQIRRLPKALRPFAVDGVRAGRLRTVADIQRLRREGDAPIRALSPHLNMPTSEAALPTHGVSDIGHPTGASLRDSLEIAPAIAAPPDISQAPESPPPPGKVSDIGHPSVTLGQAVTSAPTVADVSHNGSEENDPEVSAALGVILAVEGLIQQVPAPLDRSTLFALRQARDNLTAYIPRLEALGQ